MKRAVIALAMLAAMAAPALSASTTYPAITAPPYFTCLLTTANPTPCLIPGQAFNGPNPVPNTANFLVGVFSNSATAQTATVTCYDSLATATGTPFFIGPLGISQVINFATPGRPFFIGIVCQASVAPTGNGIEVYVR